MNGGSGPKVLVLYKVCNSKDDSGSHYNCFEMPRGKNGGVTLANVKSSCKAMWILNPSAGADGYHWRIRVDDKGSTNNSNSDGSSNNNSKFSWWDIQDENARLPIQESTMTELHKMFHSADLPPPPVQPHHSHDPVKTASATMRSLGKAMNKVVAASVDATTTIVEDTGPRICVICFKILDLLKLHDAFDNQPATRRRLPKQQRNRKPSQPKAVTVPATVTAPPPRRRTAPNPRIPPARSSTPPQRTTPPIRPPPQQQQQRPTPPLTTPSSSSTQPPAETSLMDFGPTQPAAGHAMSAPSSSFNNTNETRAERLKREYAKKNKNENRVWDDIDQRWVAVDTKDGETVQRGSTSAPPGVVTANAAAVGGGKKKIQGISLEVTSTVGKSAHVAQKMNQRASEMKQAQAQALDEVRQREMKKKQNEAEEDVIRQKLEPKIKAWSEEHGKKKQLRALLSNLHTILWPGAKWKPISLGDILDDSKCKRCFHKAVRVVHPDKTMELESLERFLAKRIFDALSQAKADLDNGKN